MSLILLPIFLAERDPPCLSLAVVPINNPLNLTERLDPLDGPPQRLLLVLDEADGGGGQEVGDEDAEVAAAGAEVHHHGGPRGPQGVTCK